MEHPASLPSSQPWRVAALVAAAIATVELFLLVLIGVALGAKLLSSEVKRVAQPAIAASESRPGASELAGEGAVAASTGTDAVLPRDETSVLVLNGNGMTGAAAVAADRVRALRYLVAGTANAERSDFGRSVVMYRPGFEAEARRLAGDVGIRRVAPLDGMRARDLQGAHIAVIVGRR